MALIAAVALSAVGGAALVVAPGGRRALKAATTGLPAGRLLRGGGGGLFTGAWGSVPPPNILANQLPLHSEH